MNPDFLQMLLGGLGMGGGGAGVPVPGGPGLPPAGGAPGMPGAPGAPGAPMGGINPMQAIMEQLRQRFMMGNMHPGGPMGAPAPTMATAAPGGMATPGGPAEPMATAPVVDPNQPTAQQTGQTSQKPFRFGTSGKKPGGFGGLFS